MTFESAAAQERTNKLGVLPGETKTRPYCPPICTIMISRGLTVRRNHGRCSKAILRLPCLSGGARDSFTGFPGASAHHHVRQSAAKEWLALGKEYVPREDAGHARRCQHSWAKRSGFGPHVLRTYMHRHRAVAAQPQVDKYRYLYQIPTNKSSPIFGE
jgi:superfamily I DNA/RNA helicase